MSNSLVFFIVCSLSTSGSFPCPSAIGVDKCGSRDQERICWGLGIMEDVGSRKRKKKRKQKSEKVQGGNAAVSGTVPVMIQKKKRPGSEVALHDSGKKRKKQGQKNEVKKNDVRAGAVESASPATQPRGAAKSLSFVDKVCSLFLYIGCCFLEVLGFFEACLSNLSLSVVHRRVVPTLSLKLVELMDVESISLHSSPLPCFLTLHQHVMPFYKADLLNSYLRFVGRFLGMPIVENLVFSLWLCLWAEIMGLLLLQMRARLVGGQFRMLNETLYTCR